MLNILSKPRLKYLPPESIISSAVPLRKEPDFSSLVELVASISRFGLLSPPVVRRKKRGCYELICGSRRLSAAKLAGLERIPCIVIQADPGILSAISLSENLQRLPLDFVEEADAFHRLSELGLSPERSAELTGVAPNRVMTALRCLNLPRSFLNKMRTNKLTARHALALSLLDGETFAEAFDHVLRFGFDGAATEKYVASLIKRPTVHEKSPPVVLVNDARLFLNTVERGVDTMRRSGVTVNYKKDSAEDGLTLTITLPKST